MEEIFVPAVGMAIEEAVLTEWLKQPGDAIAAGETLAVVETDKSTIELTSTGPGRLGRHLAGAGATVAVGATVAYVLAAGEDEPRSEPPPEDVRPRHSLSPRQRREAAARERPAPPLDGATGDDGFRAAMAASVAESWSTMPHFAVARDADARAILAAVAAARAGGAGATVTDFLLIALAHSLAALGHVADVGLAVATEWGVLVPVVRGAAELPIAEVARRRETAVADARGRRLRADQGAGPWATLSNLGPMGVTWFTGIVPLGQRALLTTGAITARPVVDGDRVSIAPMFSATLTADHRHVDGAASAQLLARFVESVERVGGDS
jgi:pyruvate dehydrogenase E2 component (dihydrolipoamide acetyltransferase)